MLSNRCLSSYFDSFFQVLDRFVKVLSFVCKLGVVVLQPINTLILLINHARDFFRSSLQQELKRDH